MRDAMGGTVTLVIVVVFIVITLGYMAFNVNYTKAFRMKNKVISVYEKYEGDCGSACEEEIIEYAKKLGYNKISSYGCPNGYSKATSEYYCYREKSSTPDVGSINQKREVYYNIVTKININVPIINNIFDFRAFQITGDTKTFEKR